MKTIDLRPLIRCFLVGQYLLAVSLLPAQQFWDITYSFPGGPKTGIALLGDSCLFVSLTGGVIRSCDETRTFDDLLTAPAVFTIYTTTTGKVLAGGAGKIYRTDDRGEHWDSLGLGGNYPVTQFLEHPDGDLFAISGTLDIEEGFVGDGVFHSSDGGESWIKRNHGLGNYTSAERIAVDRNGRLYLAVADEFVTGKGGLYQSKDKGLLWEKVNIYLEEEGGPSALMKVGRTTGLSVAPDDKVYISFSGIVKNALVQLNVWKSIDQIESEASYWQYMKVFDAVSWWLDRPLNNIHFTANGRMLSSFSGTLSTGATYYSVDSGQAWTRVDYGLGLDQFGGRNQQFFAETSPGRIYMVQLLDERIYQIDTDRITRVNRPEPLPESIRAFPNPVPRGQTFKLGLDLDFDQYQVRFFDAFGRQLALRSAQPPLLELEAPIEPGIYFVRVSSGIRERTLRLVVQ